MDDVAAPGSLTGRADRVDRTVRPGRADRADPADPSAVLWHGFDEHSAQRDRLVVLAGVPMQVADDMVTAALGRHRLAGTFLDQGAQLSRHLVHRTTVDEDRCVGHVRGPILWSETMTAWATTLGTNDVFVCASPRRDFDVAENRLVAWLLRRLVIAGRRCTGEVARRLGPDAATVLDRARRAQRLAGHPALRGVPPKRPTGREWQAVRTGRHTHTYETAIRLAHEVNSPFGPADVAPLSSERTREHHRVMLLLLEALRDAGERVPYLEVRGDVVASGPLRYRSPDVLVDRRRSGWSGLAFGDLTVVTAADSPDARTRADRRNRLVTGRAEAGDVVADVLDRARAGGGTDAQLSASGLVQLPGS